MAAHGDDGLTLGARYERSGAVSTPFALVFCAPKLSWPVGIQQKHHISDEQNDGE